MIFTSTVIYYLQAIALIKDICQNLNTAATEVNNVDYAVVLRGDSTLHGHFPEEADAAVSVLGETEFAKDACFGYKSSNLGEWVEEKTSGRIPASSVAYFFLSSS